MQTSMFTFAESSAQPMLNLDIVQVVATVNARIANDVNAAAQKRAQLAKAADAFAALLSGRAKITSPIATEIMTENLGGTDAEGAWTPQDLYNAVESGLVRALLSEGVPSESTSALALLSEIDALLVPRRRRSDEGTLFQQFSTPPAYAWLAARAAALTDADLVLEPSAGTGLLALFAHLAGARLAVNEIDEDRLALLDVLSPVTATNHDARYLSALYKGDQPSVVTMNPPFSIDHNLGSDRRVRALALSHVEQALRVTRRGGRLVAIVGHSQHPANNSEIWETVLQRATVRAAFAIDGNVYKNMGTTFGTALVVLDATVDSERPLLYTSPMSLADVVAALEEIPRRMGASGAAKHAGGQVVSLEELRTKTDVVKEFAFREKPEPVTYRARTELEGMNEDGRYAKYVPQTIVIEGAKPHPTPLIESAALACVRPPMPRYVPFLMPSLARDGILSDAQLEAVIYAGEAHSGTFELIEMDELEKSHSVEVRRGWMSGYGTGFGKGRAQPLDAEILTPSGWTEMGLVRPGDLVMGGNGKPTRVTQVFPQGKVPIFRVGFSDGASTRCTADHLWLTQTKRQRYYDRNDMGVTYPRPKVLTTSEIAESLHLGHSVPLVPDVAFEAQPVELDPYVLGAFIADAHIRSHGVELTNADDEVLDAVVARLPAGLTLRKQREYHYSVVKTEGRRGRHRSNAVARMLFELELSGKRAWEKFVPDCYKYNTREIRLEVLRGLMDCDGFVGKNASCVYYTTSEHLAADVVFLVQSLGGIATQGMKRTKKRPCHVIYIKMPEGVPPFRLSRKVARCKTTWVKYPPLRQIVSIEPDGEDYAQCIQVEDSEHLYVTNDFIVTHNCNAAIVADNFAQGRRKAIWFSESPALQEDAERDWKALTGDDTTIFTLAGVPVDVKVEREHGILFCTYATLRSKSKKNPRTRLDQIVEWLGEGFDGAILFDECHNLANAIPSRGTMGLQSGSLQGQAALDLQRRVPNARIVYVSATSASKIDALAYAPRLGLWGIGTAFANREQFLTKLDSGGTAAFELLCRDMKALGMYLSASLSYDGVTFERLIHTLTDEQKEQFNVLAGVWRLILANVNQALEGADASGLARAAALSTLEATRLRSLQAMTTSQKLPTVIDDIEKRLAEGHSIVVQLTNTNEAAQEKALSRLGEEGDLDDLDMSPREMLLDYVERCFPTQQYVERQTEDGNVISEPLKDNEGKPIANPEAIVMRESLKAHLASILVPTGPLDYLLEIFGPDGVAEVTGRHRRVVYREINGRRTRVLEERGAHANSAEMQSFREGKKRILIFSEGAGGTGFSYHADLSGGNTQRRIHYLLQTGYRSDRALQGMGRTHRTNQAAAPHYILCVTDIPGEMRFISVIARRLEALGALTRGQRDAASGGIFNAEDNLETQWGALAVASLLRTIGQSGLEGLAYTQWLDQTGLALFDSEGNAKAAQIPITRFLNRVLCCDLGPNGGVQSLIMDALMEQLEAVVEAAKRDGKFDHGIQTIPALSLVKDAQETIHTHADSGATTSVVEITATVPREAKTYGQVHSMVARARERYGRASAFFFEHPDYGIAACYPTAATQQRNGSLVPLAKIVTPSRSETIETAWTNSYVRSIVEDADAETTWKATLEAEGDTVTRRYTMITGTLLPIYDRLPEQMPEVYRVVLDDGERLIGRVIPEAQRAHTLKSLGVTATDDPDRTFDLLKSGHMVRLTNRWAFKVSRVNGSLRIELILPSEMVWSLRGSLQARGVLVETIDYRTRFFVPAGEREKAVFLDLVGQTPLAA